MNIHLITSTSNYLLKKEINNIFKKNKYITLDLSENSVDILTEECGYSFFSEENKYIVVKNCTLFDSKKKNEIEENKIINFFNSNINGVNIIFLSQSIDSRKKTVKIIKEKYNLINLTIDYKNIYEYINQKIKEEKYEFDYKLSSYLVNLYALNLDLIINELNKLFLYFDDNKKIDFEKAKEIISKPLDDNSFHFTNAVINKDINNIYKLLGDLKIYKVEPTMLIILLAREFRNAYEVKKLYNNKKGMSEIMKILKMQEWQINKIYQSSLLYNENELLKHIKHLAILDAKIKKGQIDKSLALTQFVLEVIT